MRVSQFCFFAAAVFALTGMSLGIAMGMREDFTLAPVHAHINLLGWVSLAPLRALPPRGRAPQRPAGLGAGRHRRRRGAADDRRASRPTSSPSRKASRPLIIGGSLLAVVGMALFLVILIADMRRGRRAAATLVERPA